MKLTSVVVAMAASLIILPACDAKPQSEDRVVNVEADDAVMNAAIARARSPLPVFWAEQAAPKAGERDFALKIRITDGDQNEHFWCNEIQGDATKATCAIANDPELVHTVKSGQRIDVDPERISDWMYFRGDDKIVGGETIRALLPHMPKEEADAYRAMLAE